MKKVFVSLLIGFIALMSCGMTVADLPPGPVPENQVGTLTTLIDATGIVTEDSTMHYELSSRMLNTTQLLPKERIAILMGTDSIRTSGGKLSLNKEMSLASKTGKGFIEKVLTYASTEGAHLLGSESYTVDMAGNFSNTSDVIRCVFATSASKVVPSFCNTVRAKGDLVNFNSGQVSSKGEYTTTAKFNIALNYQIAVTPDANSGSGFADGTVKTNFAGAIMEARADGTSWNHTSATNNWKDAVSVTGGIAKFQKSINYESGISKIV